MDYKSMSELELTTCYKQERDSGAYSEIYERYATQVYRFIYSLCGNREVTEDIVSDTFFVLVDELGSYTGDSKFFTYIASIAKYKLYHWYRKEAKSNRIFIDEESQLIEESSDIEIMPLNTKYVALLESVLEQLPSNYKEILIWRYIENKGIKNIASDLQKTEGNVRVLIHRALESASSLAKELIN